MGVGNARASAVAFAHRAWSSPGARFAARFGALSVGLLALYYFPHADSAEVAIDAFLRLYARLAGGILREFEPALTVVDRTITGRYSLQIAKTCDAMDVTILLVSAIIAWPASWRRRVVAAVAGVGAVFVVNIARICSLYYVGIHAPSSFDVLHLELWPAVILFVAVGFFWLYIGRPQARPG